MLIRNLNLTALVAGVAVAGSVFAAEVETMTKAPVQNLFPNAYSFAEVSHHAKSQVNKSSETARVDATYTLGSTFFNERLDTFFTVGVKKYANSSEFHQKSVDMEAWLTAYNNEFVAVKPYILGSLAHTDHEGKEQAARGQFGFRVPVSYELSTAAGAFSFGAYYDAGAKFNNNYKVTLTEDGRAVTSISEGEAEAFSLTKTEDNQYEVKPRALGLRQEAAVTVGYTPNLVSGLSLEWRTRHRVEGAPVMEYDRAANTIVAKEGNLLNQEYNQAGYTTHRVRATYDITEVFYVQNDFNFQNKLIDKKLDYVNVLAVGANLF